MSGLLLSRRNCLKALLALPLLNAPAALATASAHRIVAINWLAAEALLSLGIPLWRSPTAAIFAVASPRPFYRPLFRISAPIGSRISR